jgi:glycoside hydrolase-like protein
VSIVVDFAWTKPTVAQLHSWGAVAVGMYVSRDPAKNATRALVEQYAEAGIKTFLFFEDAADGAARGYAQGKADAELAKTQAAELGKPGWAPVLAGVDFDIPDYAPSSSDPEKKLGPVADYFKAWNEVLGLPETGSYGGYWAVSRLAAAHLATCGVQTVAWSGGKVDTKDIACLQNAQMLDGGNVDVEIIEHQNLLTRIAWVPGEANPGEVVPASHPTDASWVSKGQLSLAGLAHGPLRTDTATVLATTMKHAGLAGPVRVYVNAGDLATAKLPAGSVVWYPKPAEG